MPSDRYMYGYGLNLLASSFSYVCMFSESLQIRINGAVPPVVVGGSVAL